MSPLLILLLASVASVALAETGGLLRECPGPEWKMYRDQFEHSCLKLMPEPKLFVDTFKVCDEAKARLLSLLHKHIKVRFVNDMILKTSGENSSMWFFDPLDVHEGLVSNSRAPVPLVHPPAEPRWLVINPNSDWTKIEIMENKTAVPRQFICEAPARPAAQRAQLVREPEDVLISEELIKEAATPSTTDARRPPFVISFNCQAYGIPKPTVQWVMVYESGESKTLTTETINATITHDSRLLDVGTGVSFFNLQRDCQREACPNDHIQERSQLIIVNAHLLDPKKRIACLAMNEFGTILSREAQFFITKMGSFPNNSESVSVKSGAPIVVSNPIASDPDAASIECFRAMKVPPPPAGGHPAGASEPVHLMPLEQVNKLTRGGIQLSKAKFDLIIDAAAQDDAGQFICRVRLHNGRLGHIIREHVINLQVTPCETSDTTCNTATKPVSVVQGYPAALSMNFLSNRIIRAGDDFLLECPCIGKRRPDEELHVEWNLNNKTDLIVESLNIKPKNSAVLIRSADPKLHNGIHQCRCMRGAEASAWSSLQITVMPTPAAEHTDVIHVKPGQTAVVDCSFPALVGAENFVTVSVQPMRGAKLLSTTLNEADVKRFKLTHPSPTVYSMTISDVKETDADVYGCRVIANYLGKWMDYNTYYTTLIVDKTRRRR